jgi:hypothetical protein
MSWDKKTVSFSRINSFIEILELLNHPYELKIVKAVKDNGNDYNYDEESNGLINLHTLTFNDKIVVDYIQRSDDCDTDDYIHSVIMNQSEFNIDTFDYDREE